MPLRSTCAPKDWPYKDAPAAELRLQHQRLSIAHNSLAEVLLVEREVRWLSLRRILLP